MDKDNTTKKRLYFFSPQASYTWIKDKKQAGAELDQAQPKLC